MTTCMEVRNLASSTAEIIAILAAKNSIATIKHAVTGRVL